MTKTNNSTCYVEDGFLTERDRNEEVVQAVRLSDIVMVRRNDYLSGDPYTRSIQRDLIRRTHVGYSNGGDNDYPIDATDLLGHLIAYRNSN